MAIASITLALLLIPTSTFMLIFPIYQISFAQGNVTLQSTDANQNSVSFNTIIAGIVSGGVIGAAATLIGTYLNNRHNMNIKKQELKHDLSIELLKHRIECYAIIIKYTTSVVSTIASDEAPNHIEELFSHRLLVWADEEKGGLLMSEDSLRSFNALQAALHGRISDLGLCYVI